MHPHVCKHGALWTVCLPDDTTWHALLVLAQRDATPAWPQGLAALTNNTWQDQDLECIKRVEVGKGFM